MKCTIFSNVRVNTEGRNLETLQLNNVALVTQETIVSADCCIECTLYYALFVYSCNQGTTEIDAYALRSSLLHSQLDRIIIFHTILSFAYIGYYCKRMIIGMTLLNSYRSNESYVLILRFFASQEIIQLI